MKIDEIQQNWGLFLALGIALVVLGIFAIAWALAVSLAVVLVLGILLMVGGLAQCGEAIFSRRFTGFLIYLLAGSLYFFIGLVMALEPVRGAIGLTLVIGALFLIGGAFRIALALQTRHIRDWIWRLIGGIISLLLGLVILIRWEESLEIIGILVGIEILFTGWTVILLALAARNYPRVS
jgi:uncharacterized membrane protein HdeD (DUF308 family)